MDLLIAPDAQGRGDLVFEDGDLVVDVGLRTTSLVLLFTDARSDEVGEGQDPRGWYAFGSEPFGSLLWLLDRAVASTATANAARDYAERALAVLRRRDIAREITVQAEVDDLGRLCLRVHLARAGARHWPRLWEGELASPSSLEVEGTVLHLIADGG